MADARMATARCAPPHPRAAPPSPQCVTPQHCTPCSQPHAHAQPLAAGHMLRATRLLRPLGSLQRWADTPGTPQLRQVLACAARGLGSKASGGDACGASDALLERLSDRIWGRMPFAPA